MGSLQVVGNAQLPTPAARYSWSRGAPAPAVQVGEGSLHLNIAQVRPSPSCACLKIAAEWLQSPHACPGPVACWRGCTTGSVLP